MKMFTEAEQRKIFSRNLNKYLSLNNKTQVNLVEDLGLNKSTVSTWCAGLKMPRMGKVQALADYFGVQKSDLLDDNEEGEKKYTYYIDDETREMAQFLKDNKELKLMFDAAKDVSKDDLRFVQEMLLRMKRSENND